MFVTFFCFSSPFFDRKNSTKPVYIFCTQKKPLAVNGFSKNTLWKNLWIVWKSENQKGYIFVLFVRIMYTLLLQMPADSCPPAVSI